MGHTRRELLLNLEKSFAYIEKKLEICAYGNLFDVNSCEGFPPFVWEPVEEFSYQELLKFEKEYLGFYFSGHPLDEYRQVYERCSTVDFAHPERASANREYTLVGQLVDYKEIRTKMGKAMALGAVEGYDGIMEIVVFEKELEAYRGRFVMDQILCLTGNIDPSRKKLSFKVKKLVEPQDLRQKSIRELHITLDTVKDEDELDRVKEILMEGKGQCSIVFHVPEKSGTVMIRANNALSCSADDELLSRLRTLPVVKDTWFD